MKLAASLFLVLVMALAFGVLPGCADRTLPPPGQLLLYVDTDAPLALGTGEIYSPDKPAELFDQMRVEVLGTNGDAPVTCTDCTRDFAVDRDRLANELTSIGLLVAPNRMDLTVRVRLFRAIRLQGDGEPPAESTIDEVFSLPPIGDEGVVERTAHLTLARVGLGPSAAPQPLLDERVFAKTLFPGVTPRPCQGPALQDEVCIPGGAFWMSNAETTVFADRPPGHERVAIVSPFYVGATEVTVKELRASGLAVPTDPALPTELANCTYSASPGPNDALPVTCTTYATALKYCGLSGRTLLTEAQYELMGSGLRSHRFVWGDDAPSCTDTIFARSPNPKDEAFDCLALGSGPAPPRSGKRDVLELPGGKVYDLAGNVREMVRDTFQPLASPCWSPTLQVDPVCQAASGGLTVRGGGVNAVALFMRVTERAEYESLLARPVFAGFRCARSAL